MSAILKAMILILEERVLTMKELLEGMTLAINILKEKVEK